MVMRPNNEPDRSIQAAPPSSRHAQREAKTNHEATARLRVSFVRGSQADNAGFIFNQDLITIGRGAECDIVLEGETISRQHCLIARSNTGYALQDSSRNGTFVNDHRAAQSQLKNGDRIKIGPHLMTVAFAAAATPTQAFTEKKTRPHPSLSPVPYITVEGCAQGGTQSFEQDLITLGRTNDNQVVIEADNISRKHLAIERRVDTYFVRDLGSINGTRLNERKIKSARLQDGDKLRIGNVLISVHLRNHHCILQLAQALK